MTRTRKKLPTILVAAGWCLGLALIAAFYPQWAASPSSPPHKEIVDHQWQQTHDENRSLIEKVADKTIHPESTEFVLGIPISNTLEGWNGGDQLSLGSRGALHEQLNTTIAQLQAEQILPSIFSTVAVQFELPIRSTVNTGGYGYHTISNYLDHNSTLNALQDYRCGELTYDASDGYNHTGTDFMPFPFPWEKMDRNEVEVIAAADGVIIVREDGRYDLECEPKPTQGNIVILQHNDGTKSWYLHLKNGSVLDKKIGDSVTKGEYLGSIGSSGRSSGPHLHFEVQDASGNVIDPFFASTHASCNPTTDKSLWVNQPEYAKASVNGILTSSVTPEFPLCQKTILPEQTQFMGGDKLVINVFYRNDSASLKTDFNLMDPSGTSALTWSHQPQNTNYKSAVWSFPISLPSDIALGTWRIMAAYNGQEYESEVSFVESVPATATPTSTFTPVPTAAPATGTPVPATATATATAVPTTAVPTATAKPTSTSTSTPTSAPTNTPTPRPSEEATTSKPPTAAPVNSVYLPAVTK